MIETVFYLMIISSGINQVPIVKDNYEDCREARREQLMIFNILAIDADIVCLKKEVVWSR